MNEFLITGASGFLGREVLGRLLVEFPTSTFHLILRAESDELARKRVEKILFEIFGLELGSQFLQRVHAHAGDLTINNFGWGDSKYKALANSVDGILHSAADTDLKNTLKTARKINVGGTAQVVKFAELAAVNKKVSLFHTSTAYVAGDTERTVMPGEIGSHFKNYYEQSKAEAEELLLGLPSNIESSVLRPSVIVGDSVTGQASSFNVIYVPARFLMKGLLTVLPASPHVPFDVVPVDYVADSVVKIIKLQPRSGSCFHLSAGAGRESTPLEILEQIFHALNEFFRKKHSMPPLVSPELILKLLSSQTAVKLSNTTARTLERIFGRRIEMILKIVPFIPYMIRNPRFDTTSTVETIRLEAPRFDEYATRVFLYCLETNWGREPWNNPHNLDTWVHRNDKALALA